MCFFIQLSVQPRFRVQLFFLPTQLEVQYRPSIIRTVRKDLTDGLLRLHRITGFDGCRRKIAINRNIIAMTNENIK